MVAARALLIVGAMACTSACSLAFPGDDYTSGSGGAASGGNGNGANGGDAGAGGCSGSGCQGELQGDALVARYFIDEAASGTGPPELLDTTSTGPDLTISYQTNLQFVESAGNRGLLWASSVGEGVAAGPIGTTPLVDALSAVQKATIELVVAVDVRPGTLLQLSGGLELRLSTTTVEASWGLLEYFDWTGFEADGARHVLHLVIDTSAQDQDAMVLQVDAARMTPDGNSYIAPNVELQLATADSILHVGNEELGGDSIAGGIFYLAIYGSALTEAQIDNNKARLLASDDGP